MDKVKRERSANFRSEERDLLVSLVQKYSNIIENKQSDGATWKKKELAWELIEKEFNAQCDTFRSSKTLRIKYEGLKRTVRKKSAAIRSELYRTGGGPNTATPLDGTELHVKSMITLSTDGLDSIYDSDVLPSVQNEDNELKLSMEEYIVLPSTSADTELVTKVDSAHFDEPPLKKQHMLHENEIATEECLLSNKVNDEPSLKTQNDLNENEIAREKSLLSKDSVLENIPCGSTPLSHKKWDVTSRRNLRTKRHPALIANTPNESKKSNFDILTEKKLELVLLQKELLEAELIEKKKEWEFNEQERQRKIIEEKKESEFNEKQRQWKEEEFMLKLAKLRKELND